MHANSYQSLLWSLSLTLESSSSASVSDSAGESLAIGSNWYGLTVSRSPSTSYTSDSSPSTEETEQDRLRLPESLLLWHMVADFSLFNAQGVYNIINYLLFVSSCLQCHIWTHIYDAQTNTTPYHTDVHTKPKKENNSVSRDQWPDTWK